MSTSHDPGAPMTQQYPTHPDPEATAPLPKTAPAINPPRWRGRKTAVAAALAIGLSSAGAVAAAATVEQGSTGREGGGPGGGQGFPGGQQQGQHGQQGGQNQQQVPGQRGQQQAPGQMGQQGTLPNDQPSGQQSAQTS
ncbi:hypothetical protein ACFY2Y_16035 [Janibacter hoylei]|uniref:hypothetical protein n=1 Tax=Janibacter hoylei TaxID=364298 RepID=UPI0036A8042A